MGLITRTQPVGVDVTIGRLQRDLFIELTNIWNRDYESFPRIYKNHKGDDVLPEWCKENGEYTGDLLFDDTKTVNSFWVVDDDRTYDHKKYVFTHNAAMIVQAKLDKLYKDCKDKSRLDEKIVDDVRRAIKATYWTSRYKEAITGIDKIYSDFKISDKKKYFYNMSNFCTVRFNFVLLYDNTLQSNPLK